MVSMNLELARKVEEKDAVMVTNCKGSDAEVFAISLSLIDSVCLISHIVYSD